MSNGPKKPPFGARNPSKPFLPNPAKSDARSPDETGLISFVPEGNEGEEENISATKFYEITPSKQPPIQQPPVQQPPKPPNPEPFVSHKPPSAIGIGGTSDLPPRPPSYNPYPPIPPSPPTNEDKDVSYRMYAILVTMFAVVLIAALVAVYIVMNQSKNQSQKLSIVKSSKP